MAYAVALSTILVLATLLFHYESLRLISENFLAPDEKHSHFQITYTILMVFLVHLVEIGAYALVLWFAHSVVDIGDFAGARPILWADYFYFSAETFTTLGLGDIYPIGALRLIASIEPINGLLLIGWSTSFTFLAMQRYWAFGKEVNRAALASRPARGFVPERRAG
ncbi:MAG: potassium channel family protein [Alphaproteobacteria bacterium]